MAWVELRVHTTNDKTAQLEPLLESTGALAVTFTDAGDQPIFEPNAEEMPLWHDVVVVALYEATRNTDEIESALRNTFESAELHWNPLEDRIWEREWLQHQKPIKFGDAFWVYHEQIEDDTPTLLLDPGLAFGTGSHPTTALCLEWIASQQLTRRKVLDYGCGSGILAVAALLSGAGQADCVDIDQQALDATKNNAARNSIGADKINTYMANDEPKQTRDLVIANILYGPLLDLAPRLARYTRTGGHICLSGVLHAQMEGIIATYTTWFTHFETAVSGDWGRIVATRNAVAA